MRRKDKKITDQKIIEEILTKSHICRIALFDEDHPYIVPLNYGYDGKFLFFHGAAEGKKINLIKENNKVGFEIEQGHEIITADLSCDWTTKYRSIVGAGSVEIITDFKRKKIALDCIMKQHGREENQYQDKTIDRIVVLKVKIAELSAKQSGNWS